VVGQEGLATAAEVVQDSDAMSTLDQRVDEVRTDEPGPPGDQFHGRATDETVLRASEFEGA